VIIITELDALLDRIREVSKPSTAVGRSLRFEEVARDCLRMFEDLATRYKEEFAARDRYKAQLNSWRDKALELADETEIAKLKLEAACPCCRGASILQPCQECHGSKIASVAYDTLRVHYKLLQESVQWKPIETAPRDGMILIAHNHWGTVNVTLAEWGRVNYGCGQFEDGWRSHSGFLTGAKWWCAIPSVDGLLEKKAATDAICVHPIGRTTCGYKQSAHWRADGSPIDHPFTPEVARATDEHPAIHKTADGKLVAGRQFMRRAETEEVGVAYTDDKPIKE
jgi:hypothetical protein